MINTQLWPIKNETVLLFFSVFMLFPRSQNMTHSLGRKLVNQTLTCGMQLTDFSETAHDAITQ